MSLSLVCTDLQCCCLQVLRQSGGALELVDEASRLPELQRVRGLQTWSLKAKGSWFSSFEAAEQVPHSFLSRMTQP